MISCAMGEVDEPHDAEDQADAERGQRVEAADAERIDQRLDGLSISRPPSRAIADAEIGGVEVRSWRSSSAGVPASVKAPPLITQARSASAKARSAFCSTSRMATPLSRISRHAARRPGRRSPARGRATARRASAGCGRDSSARAMASCCCSPPESWPAGWSRRCAEDREGRRRSASMSARDRQSHRAGSSRRAGGSPSTVRLAKMWRPSGTSAMPRPTTSSSARPASGLPAKLDRSRRPARRCRRWPRAARSCRRRSARRWRRSRPRRPRGRRPARRRWRRSGRQGRRRPRSASPRSGSLQRGRSRDRRGAPRDRRRISSGVPAAMVRPPSSTWMRSQRFMTQRHVVLDDQHAATVALADRRRSDARRSSASAGARPAAGSSRSRKRGLSGERAGEADAALLAIAEPLAGWPALSREAEIAEHLARPPPRLGAAEAACRHSRPRHSR